MNKKITVLGVIPARYSSSRFEGKPLVEIGGIPMIKRTYVQAKQATSLDGLIVATDDKRIVEYCESESISVMMTSLDCLTGTDRVAEVAESHPYDFYINIQGDEPVIDPDAITQLIQEYKLFGNKYMAYNLYKIISDEAEINSDTIIKVIVNERDELMYMSRFPVPYSKSNQKPEFKQQIPVYGFTREALKIFSEHRKTNNEQFEDIELLRFIDLGYKLKMKETFADSISVDIPSDVRKIEKWIQMKNERK
jgi:3-deoxy-manno-octulosonate cytidylyltransferase (CMP-KDO synthetase)